MTDIPTKVLVVDDDRAILRLVKAWLTDAGYLVETEESATVALERIERECPNFVLTDWMMPGMEGPELCRRIRAAKLPHYTFIMLLTGKTGQDNLIEALEAGADDFMTKPVARSELLARLKAGLRVLSMEHELQRLARLDPLTGLPSRRALRERLDMECQRATRYRNALSCVMIDVDFFKRVNDEFGHPAGDAVLKRVAEHFQRGSRTVDFVCRCGGEEFCVLLPETDEQQAAIWAERLRIELERVSIPTGGRQLQVTASFGVAELTRAEITPEALVEAADQALLAAKATGRNRVVRFGALGSVVGPVPAAADGPYQLFRDIPAQQIMVSPAACLADSATVDQAADFFLSYRLGSAPVVDGDGLLVGFLSERDVLGLLSSTGAWKRTVREIMRTNVICYDEETPSGIIHDFLCRVAVRSVVIVRDRRPVGVVSRSALLRRFQLWRNFNAAGCSTEAAAAESARDRDRIRDAVMRLAAEAQALERRVDHSGDDMLAAIVHGVGRMEELLQDLLVQSPRLAAQSDPAAAPCLLG